MPMVGVFALPHTVTIYDVVRVDETHNDIYRYVLSGVLYSSHDAVSNTSKGSKYTDKSTVNIPFNCDCDCKGFVSIKKWLGGDSDFKAEHFTLRNKQIVLKGDVELDIKDNEINLDEAKKLYNDIFTIDKIITVDYGSEMLQHWKIQGV